MLKKGWAKNEHTKVNSAYSVFYTTSVLKGVTWTTQKKSDSDDSSDDENAGRIVFETGNGIGEALEDIVQENFT